MTPLESVSLALAEKQHQCAQLQQFAEQLKARIVELEGGDKPVSRNAGRKRVVKKVKARA